MITIRGIPVCRKEYKKSKLSGYFTKEEHELAKKGEDILEDGVKYSIEIPSFGDKKELYLPSIKTTL